MINISQKQLAIKFILALIIALSASCRGEGVKKVAEFTARDQILPITITLVSWNAQKAADPLFFSDLDRLLRQYKPDIVFLQEARVDLIKAGQMGGYFANGWSYPWPGGTMVGVMTLSRIPPMRIESVSSNYREFFVTAPKVSLLTEFPLSNGDSLLAVNVHLLNFERWGDLKIRDQLEELKFFLKTHHGPIIMAGDFNTWNERRLQLVEEIVSDLKLTEVSEFPMGRTTGDMKSEFFNSILGIQAELPLDRVYYRGISVESAQVLLYDSSDHKPIAVKLSLG